MKKLINLIRNGKINGFPILMNFVINTKNKVLELILK